MFIHQQNSKFEESDLNSDIENQAEEWQQSLNKNKLSKIMSKSSSKEMSVIDEDNEEPENQLKYGELQHTKSQMTKNVVFDLMNKKNIRKKLTHRSPNKKKIAYKNTKEYFGNDLDKLISEITETEDEVSTPEVQGEILKWIYYKKITLCRFGDIFCALNVNTGCIFTVKRLNLYKSANIFNTDWVESLKAEVNILKNYSHKNIIKYIGSEIHKDKFMIYLEYASEKDLVNMYKKFGPLKESMIRIYTKQILEALDYLHSNNIAHYDIKWANVLVDSNGEIKLWDFDWARLIKKLDSDSNYSLHKGTTPWMAPEVIEQKEWTLKSDIWSLGWTVVEMSVAGNPWRKSVKGTIDDMIKMITLINQDIKPPIPDSLSENCKDFILKCLVRDISKRASWKDLLSHPFITNLPE
jgi:serine/threonine protein kinase